MEHRDMVNIAGHRKYTEAINRQNKIAESAIQSLDSLNDQIVQYIFSANGNVSYNKGLSINEQDAVKSSVVLIRRLLHDAQGKFRKMVEDNRHLASKIDCSIHAANQEVSILRAELQDTNKRLSQIGMTAGQRDCATQCDVEYTPRQKADEENELIRLREENARLEMEVKLLSCDSDLQKEVANESSRYGEVKLELIQSKQELTRAKEALQAMKADRKRLKAEKLELLNQMKLLYTTLEDKETELRDFIRNYEQQMRENDETIKQLASERETVEQEKFEILRQARDAQERAVILRTQVDLKDQQIKKLESELSDLKEQSIKLGCSLTIPDTPLNGLGTVTPNSEDLPPYETPPSSAHYNSREGSFEVSSSTPKLSRKDRTRSSSLTPLINDDSCAKLQSSPELNTSGSSEQKKKHKRISLGSLSKVFTRGKVRRSIAIPDGTDLDDLPGNTSRITLLNSDNYQEKLTLIEQSKGSHMTTWKANQVLAWLEIVINMPMYGKMCSENVKSGKVLLGLSDSELSSALGITNPMHRKKLRLAIEEQRNPNELQQPKASSLDHTWVAHRWMPDLGLPQCTSIFETNLVDGRVLNSLTKKEMEKHFNIQRKFHQASILHSVELLRRLGFDKEVLNERRTQCENSDTDPLVWTNERVIKWVRSIDLEEYAKNLKESGVHGALMVLEPMFNSDTLATALGIPPSKSYIRRHLKTELESLVKSARESVTVCNGSSKLTTGTSTLGRSFRSSSVPGQQSGSKSRLSFRGSLGRAFGRKMKDDLNKFSMDLETPKRKISSPMNFQHNTLQSVFEQEHPKT
ncbi:hypothetical protein FSP39_003916 [Pinctada imbricata]|uniref:SAM domain-containing protein n=1 Tax=Pinctada imbricata TaxID=66713 RepID=A0AA88YFJ0_PINIB|nr:hypothetical protein FSP39_003916 [Pinctada imbricata]